MGRPNRDPQSTWRFRRLAPQYANTVVIDRDGVEFYERGGLIDIINAAGLPPYHDIPYKPLDR